MEKTLSYKASIQEIPNIRQELIHLGKGWVIPDSELRQIGVIIEEIFSNIVRFAYTDKNEHTIAISIIKRQEDIMVRIIDDGIPFNPLEYDPGSVADPASADAGGMGLTLVQTFSDSIVYLRTNDENHLEITKRIKSNPESTADSEDEI